MPALLEAGQGPKIPEFQAFQGLIGISWDGIGGGAVSLTRTRLSLHETEMLGADSGVIAVIPYMILRKLYRGLVRLWLEH